MCLFSPIFDLISLTSSLFVLKSVFLGYSLAHKGYLYLSSLGRIHISRNVVFHLNKSPSLPSSSAVISSQLPVVIGTLTIDPSHIFPSPSTLSSSPSPVSAVSSPAPCPSSSINTNPMTTRAKAGIFKPKAYIATKHPLPETFLPREPKSVKQALQDSV